VGDESGDVEAVDNTDGGGDCIRYQPEWSP
jgi:hypothetical protein